MAHTRFCLGLTALTGERLERLYLFSRLKHLLEYISEYRGGLGQNFRPGNLTPIQAIPYTHNRTTETWATLLAYFYDHHIQWGKKVFSQPPIVQVLPLKKMREACNFHHRYTSTMRDKIRKKNPENHIVGFLNNLFANYGGK